MEAKIKLLKPGQSVLISEVGSVKCYAERSGSGDTIRFVRVEGDKTTVYHTEKFTG